MDRVASALTFNGPLEAGVRSVAVLAAAYPNAYDIGQLSAFDFLLVRTGELHGPESLHPPSPIQSPDATVRRRVVQDGINLMISRDLIERVPSKAGILYAATDLASPFLDSFSSTYLRRLKERAVWLAEYAGDRPPNAINEIVRNMYDSWVMEFQDIERSLGGPA